MNDPDQQELSRRVIYSSLLPAVRMARYFGVSFKELAEWSELAALKEMIDAGYKLKEIAAALGVSVRKVSALSSKLRENFFVPETKHELPARIEFLLWAQAISRARIKQYLAPADEGAIDDAIDALEAAGRIRLVPGRTPVYEATSAEQRLVHAGIASRIDALNSLLGTTIDAVFSRFFGRGDDAFARALQLRARPQDLERLRAFYEQVIWPELRAIDEAAQGAQDAVELGAAICWAPLDRMKGALHDKIQTDVHGGGRTDDDTGESS